MDIQFVREFISVAEGGPLSAVADQYYIAPSLLSTHIRKIEDELGYPLFDRTSRTLVLNRRGQLFLHYAKKLVAVYDEYRSEAAKAEDANYGQLLVGLIGSVARTTAESLITDFYRRNPDVKLTISSRDYPHTLMDLLYDGRCDFIFLYDAAVDAEKLKRLPLFTDRIVAVLPRSHPLSSKERIGVRELRNEDILMQNSDNGIFQKISEYFENQGVRLNVSFAVNSPSLMEDMLELGAGIGLMTLTGAEKLKSGMFSVLPIEPELSMEFSMLYLDKPEYAPVEKRFLRYIRNRFRAGADSGMP